MFKASKKKKFNPCAFFLRKILEGVLHGSETIIQERKKKRCDSREGSSIKKEIPQDDN